MAANANLHTSRITGGPYPRTLHIQQISLSSDATSHNTGFASPHSRSPLRNLFGSLHLANEGMDRFGQGVDRIRYLNDRLLVGRRHSVDLFQDFFELALIHFDRPPNVYLEPAIGP